VGLRDAKLSEQLQLDSELTLEKAITVARQSESVKVQQKSLRSPIQGEPVIAAVHTKRKPAVRHGTNQAPASTKKQEMAKKSDKEPE
jgi:hypothetical protein